eukprot:scaffold132053_cov69-Phaeocystis_antarctica.AAC.3
MRLEVKGAKGSSRADRLGGSRLCQCLTHGCRRRGAGRDALKINILEGWQRAAVERSGENGAASVGDLGVAE